ncbi:MAG: transglycosylase SLT domain-containing protein, partial [Paracoccaceae bacterium]
VGSGCLNTLAANTRRAICHVFTAMLVLVFAQQSPVRASVNFSDVCNTAARLAAQRTGVPEAVLRAITLTETGRKSGGSFEAWPWTVNMEGKGVWSDSEPAARAYAEQNYRRGARSFDVGCFQLNYKWHGQAFASIEEMFDPVANATYAANFLLELYAEKGNWPAAAAAYHSRTPKFADKYRRRFQRIYAQLQTDEPGLAGPPMPATQLAALQPAPPPPPRINNFPLLQGRSAAQSGLGSLFPTAAGSGARRLIGGG